MTLFIQLLLAHFIGDFLLQPTSWVKAKEEKIWRAPQLYYHTGVHLVLSLLLVWNFNLILPILIIVFFHYWIDIGKLSLQHTRHGRLIFIIDQMLHIAVILIVAEYCSPFIEQIMTPEATHTVWVFILCLVLVTFVSSRVIKILISKWAPETGEQDEESLSDAGNYIGILERLFVFGFIITNHLASIGFLLAAKSIFRFGDLRESKDRKLTEYILIGTFLSFGLAILTGVFYLFFAQIG